MIIPTGQPFIHHLKDYRPPDFRVEALVWRLELYEDKAVVFSQLALCRVVTQGRHQRPLVLDGEELTLLSVAVDGRSLEAHEYQLTPTQMIIEAVPDHFTLQTVTEIYPQKNTALSGLYRSNGMFCTQCEAQGFRRITYYLDRPDVMAAMTTTIVADKTHYPILLSNGNPVEMGTLDGNRHWVTWEDPFKKPSYLFALVAGNLAKKSDHYRTASGRDVMLEVYVEPGNEHKCDAALSALKAAMHWDEVNYGREYDLDRYMIVAVNDFNMGAMENKGLNIFNAKYVLADHNTATDTDFQNIEAVIGHEYFHNWTGNRITCRDWFQLSLKEGLTVFREQAFSASMGWPVVKRIQDVKQMRTRQFAEDAGPLAHPVRPESYMEINNFYTSTVYNKGAEVIRVLYTLLGKEKFRRGMDQYFARHDGQAVTIEDFITAFEDANEVDLKQMYRWYQQAGTPVVDAQGEYDAATKTYTLRLTQTCPPTPGQQEKKPFIIPIKIALYDSAGERLPLHNTAIRRTDTEEVIVMTKAQETYIFESVAAMPIPSLLGNFSAPVILHYPYTESSLIVLMKHDHDLFNRWDSVQRLNMKAIEHRMEAIRDKRTASVSDAYFDACEFLLNHDIIDPALYAKLFMLPSFNYIAQTQNKIDVDVILQAQKEWGTTFATRLKTPLEKTYYYCEKNDDRTLSSAAMGYRALKNVCLWHLVRHDHATWLPVVEKQYTMAQNMTDRMGALSALNDIASSMRDKLFEDFYERWKHDPLIVNKWLALHAVSELPDTLLVLEKLLAHESFDMNNPNKVYALIHTFGASNPVGFHRGDGKGYEFIAARVMELNHRNPQVASRLVEKLTQWNRLTSPHSELMKRVLVNIREAGPLSEDVYEMITKSLMG